MKTIFVASFLCASCAGFAPAPSSMQRHQRATSLGVFGSPKPNSSQGLSPLPKGISPFEKSLSKNLNIQAEFRQRAKRAIDAATADNVKLMEIEFPPVSEVLFNCISFQYI